MATNCAIFRGSNSSCSPAPRGGPFTLDVTGRLVSERFVTSDETQALAPYQVLDVRLAATHALGPVAVTLDLTVENALDADYQVIRFYPMPPRHARLRLRFDMQP